MTRRAMPYHRRYQADALTGYANLTLEERGAYTTLLDLMYEASGPISSERRMLAGWMQCSVRKVDALLSVLMTKGKIYITRDGKLSNRRVEQELRHSLEISRKAAENASKPRRNGAETEKKANRYNGARERPLSGRPAIPVPDPDIIPLEYEETDARDADVEQWPGELERSAAEPAPIRRETYRPPLPARQLFATTAADPAEPIPISTRLLDSLERGRGASRWPVPARAGGKGFPPK